MIARYDLPTDGDPVEMLDDHDWAVAGAWTEVEPGYLVANITRKG